MCYMEQKMQQQMEAGEHEYNELMEQFYPPDDWDIPRWEVYDKVHNWRNYASEAIMDSWNTFTGRQKIMLSRMLQDIADSEHWD